MTALLLVLIFLVGMGFGWLNDRRTRTRQFHLYDEMKRRAALRVAARAVERAMADVDPATVAAMRERPPERRTRDRLML